MDSLSLNHIPNKDLHYLTTRTLLLLTASIVALSIGGWIYVVGRPGTYIYGIWHAYVASTPEVCLPDFVLYSLPNGLWSFSSILLLHSILTNEPPLQRLTITSVIPLLGIISELLQGLGVLSGVFDPYDLVCYALPYILYLFANHIINIQCINHENLQKSSLHYL